MSEQQRETEQAIEALLDSVGWDHFLTALETVCHEKADHVFTNWQDRTLAQAWTRAAREIDKLIGKAIL